MRVIIVTIIMSFVVGVTWGTPIAALLICFGILWGPGLLFVAVKGESNLKPLPRTTEKPVLVFSARNCQVFMPFGD